MSKKDSLKDHVTKKKRSDSGYWHGGKKKDSISYEGSQYRGGRKEKTPNLKKVGDGKVQNQHGIIFTDADKKALEREANKANARRKRMIETEGKLPRLAAGQETGGTVSQLQLMGKESDFILSRKSKSLQRFKTREQYDEYMSYLRKVNSPEYLNQRIDFYKENHIKALQNAFNSDAKDVIDKIRTMKNRDYMKMMQQDEILEISYIYGPEGAKQKLNQIRKGFKIKIKD